jgi:hypothetical protein
MDTAILKTEVTGFSKLDTYLPNKLASLPENNYFLPVREHQISHNLTG